MGTSNEPAPAPGQARNYSTPSPSTALVTITSTVNRIIFSPHEPCGTDARLPGGRYARYVTDPGAGLWRIGRDGVREPVSPFALVSIEFRRYAYAIAVTLPRTGEAQTFEGDLDQIASEIHQAGVRLGCRGDRQPVYWALVEFCQAARRQAARGVAV